LEGRICTFDNFFTIILLAYSVFAEDEKMQEKIDLVFSKITRDALVDSWIMDFSSRGNIWT
jgi:hypothetical protein